MRHELLEKMACPACRSGNLKTAAAETRGEEIVSGSIRCQACGRAYRITAGLPWMVPDENVIQQGVWDSLHQRMDYSRLAEEMKQRMAVDKDFLEDYFSQAVLVREQGESARTVLDIGCGSGTYSLAVACLAGKRDLTLLDLSPAALQGAGRLLGLFGCRVHLVVGDIHRLPFQDRAYDLAMSGGLIEHFTGAEQAGILAEHLRVSGQVVIQAPESTLAYWGFRRLYTLLKGGWPFGFEQPLRRRAVRGWLEERGFTITAWGSHDFASAVQLLLKRRWSWFPRLHRWPGLAALTRHDLLVAARRTKG